MSLTEKIAAMEINYYLSKMSPEELAATLKLFRAVQAVKTNYVGSVDGVNLLTGSVKGMVNSLGDPYSVYMDPKMFSELMLETKGSFGGVGIVLGVKDKKLTVVAPIEGTPAEAAGILSGDQIVRIDAADTKDMTLDEAVGKIRGPEGSKVTLTIERTGKELREFPLTRATIVIKSVSGKMLDKQMGYVRISMFSETTSKDFVQKLDELKEQGMTSLVLDLRNNPGGLIDQCVKVAELLVPQGPIVSVIGKDGGRETYQSSLKSTPLPLVVLVNGGSASASEIVAGAIQDRGAGKLVGVKTFGKGSVQRLVPLDKDSALKITIAEYHTPSDRSIHGKGIVPDVVVEIPKDFDKESKQDPQLDKAVEVLKESLMKK
ncbi:MAG: S41 family peptidase [Veillonellaceae bacterium]|nr:S41 family peptidase [Veillonellaceae bacterium]